MVIMADGQQLQRKSETHTRHAESRACFFRIWTAHCLHPPQNDQKNLLSSEISSRALNPKCQTLNPQPKSTGIGGGGPVLRLKSSRAPPI
eukprot:803432-Rhodomonas_salina.1